MFRPPSIPAVLRYANRPLPWLAALVIGTASQFAQAQATEIDILVNHDAFPTQAVDPGSTSGVVDGPAGGEFAYRAKVKINGSSGSVDNVKLTQELPAGAIFQGIDAPLGVRCVEPLPKTGDTIVAGQTIECTIARLTPSFVNVDFRVVLPTKGTGWIAKASASAPGNVDLDADYGEPNHSNIARGITIYERAELAVDIVTQKISGTSTGFTQGDQLFYGVTVSNTDSPYAYPLKTGEQAHIRFPQPEGTSFQGDPAGALWSCLKDLDTSTTPAVPVWDPVHHYGHQ